MELMNNDKNFQMNFFCLSLFLKYLINDISLYFNEFKDIKIIY